MRALVLAAGRGVVSAAVVACLRRKARLWPLRAAAPLLTIGRPRGADRLLTRGLRLDLLACQGGPEGDLPSAARVDRAYRRRGGMDDFGARAAAEKI